MNKAKPRPTPNSAPQLSRLARERADEQARSVPWRRLYEARTQYIDWQQFSLWVRSIFEVEEHLPDWLSAIVEDRCPGFLEFEGELDPTRSRPLPLRLEDWIDEHVFGFAKNEGWFNAIAYYAIRDPRYQRAEVCWAQCVKAWKHGRPIRYPSFEEWQALAASCDDAAHLVPGERMGRACAKLVERDRLSEAVARYIDWEALAYWVRPAFERCAQPPPEVATELQHRCPGFLEASITGAERWRGNRAQLWEQLMIWIANHFFADAKAEGWFNAILQDAGNHPRAERTREYADHCDEVWRGEIPVPYPSFPDWRRDADSFVELRTR